MKSHVASELVAPRPKEHPMVQLIGRTVFEHVTGHRMKTSLAIFGEKVAWRSKRNAGALNKYDSEWSDGIYMGLAGSGVEQTNDFRTSPDGSWDQALFLSVPVSFENYTVPSAEPAEVVILDAPVHAIPGAYGV